MKPKVAILQCCKTKSKYPGKARDVYKGTLFRKALSWAEKNCDEIRIVSSALGVIHPDDWITPYDVTAVPKGCCSDEAETIRLSREERAILRRQIYLSLESLASEFDLVYLCNRVYAETGPAGEWPTKGLKFGQQLQWFTQQVAKR
jgi:hypothetical protein